jgi:Ni,Fe-hydrogenase I small subunit
MCMTYIFVGRDACVINLCLNNIMACFMGLSGQMEKALNQLKEVKSEVTVMEFGIDCTGCSSLIRSTLEFVRQIV